GRPPLDVRTGARGVLQARDGVFGGVIFASAPATLLANGDVATRTEHASKEENPMKLTAEQIEVFNREGWLFLPELFRPEEVDFLASEAVSIYDANRPEVWREKSGAPRTAFAAHLYNQAFGLLAAHPRMIEPIEQIFGEKLYMHQFKINAKAAFT